MSTATEFLTVKDIATALNVSVMAAHRLITSKELPAINIGKGTRSFWRVARVDFDSYLADQKAATARRFETAAS